VTQRDLATFDRLAEPYDRGMAPLEKLWLRRMRAQLIAQAKGKVLEVGVGTGANLPFYTHSPCLSAVDESPDMLAVVTHKAFALHHCIYLSQGNAEHLAFPSGYFDTVVATLVLCSVVDQQRTIGELWRVLRKPGGHLLLLEHMRPRNRPLAWLMDLANIPWYAANGRCHLNRTTQQAIIQAGFEVLKVESKLGGFFRSIIARAG
jgi:ubiquinone/menaquinone biosynthesis C-methylase UbiE